MKTKIAINGFGRIGRNAFKIAFQRPDLEIAAINDLTDTKTLAHLLKHDSNYGAYQHDVSSDEQNIIVNDQKIKVLSEKDPAQLPWKDLGVEIVIESTGLFTDPAKAKAHIAAGAKKVIISAPAKGEGAETIVLGVNEDKIGQAGEIISNASCTTNSITPVMSILEANFGIEKASMTTIHSYTASQVLLDGPAKDIREARNAATNIVPTTTGASVAAAKAMPALEGIFGGLSIRVPTPVVSLSDFSVVTKRNVTVEEVNEALKKAAADAYYQGILDVTEEELVSSDFIGNSHSAIVDLKLTNVVGGNLVKVVAWYDNEWGYSNRLIELAADVARSLGGDHEKEDEVGKKEKQTSEEKKDEDKPAEPKHDHSHHRHHEKQEAGEPKTDDETPGLDAPMEEPRLEAPQSAHEDLLEAPVSQSSIDESKIHADDESDKSATGDDTSSAGYIIGGESSVPASEDKPAEPPKRPPPPDATNIDGVHRF